MFEYSNGNFYILKILIFCLPFVFIILIEDVFQNLNPSIRLITLLLSAILFCTYGIENLPILEIPYIDNILNNPWIAIIFYSLAITGYINGVNFIDGTNGLASITVLCSLLCLLFLSILFQDYQKIEITVYLISILLGFLFINYPLGKVFLGDLGAYFIGWMTAIITIDLMASNSNIPNWCAVSILSYPVIEVLFSILRKLFDNKNPMYPDKHHLHLKLFFLLESKLQNKLIANSLVAPFLSLIWLMPLVLIPWIYSSKFMVILAVLIQLIIYFTFYLSIPRKN